MDKGSLWAFVYVSTISGRMKAADMEGFLVGARQRNKFNDITGLLLYCNGCFMQYLEGPKEALHTTMKFVSADKRHHGFVELFNSAVDAREFEGWAMACSEAAEGVFQDLRQAAWLIGPNNEEPLGRGMLRAFWHNNNLR